MEGGEVGVVKASSDLEGWRMGGIVNDCLS